MVVYIFRFESDQWFMYFKNNNVFNSIVRWVKRLVFKITNVVNSVLDYITLNIVYFVFNLIVSVVTKDKLPIVHYFIIWIAFKYEVFQWYIVVYIVIFALLQLSISYKSVGDVFIIPFKKYLTTEDFKLVGNTFSAPGAKAGTIMAKSAALLIKAAGAVVVADHVYHKLGANAFVNGKVMSQFGASEEQVVKTVAESLKQHSVLEKTFDNLSKPNSPEG